MKSGRFDAEYIVTLRFPLIEKAGGRRRRAAGLSPWARRPN